MGRSFAVIATALVLVVLSTAFQPVQDVVQKRFETLSDLRNDGSLQDRQSGYEELFDYVISDPLGYGLGAMETVLNGKSEMGGRDSGILEILLSLGFPGGAVYFLALAMVVRSGFAKLGNRTTFEGAAGAIGVAMVCHMVLASISTGFGAVALWGFAGISVASQVHVRKSRFRSLEAPVSCT
jgi:O-antigen ligase